MPWGQTVRIPLCRHMLGALWAARRCFQEPRRPWWQEHRGVASRGSPPHVHRVFPVLPPPHQWCHTVAQKKRNVHNRRRWRQRHVVVWQEASEPSSQRFCRLFAVLVWPAFGFCFTYAVQICGISEKQHPVAPAVDASLDPGGQAFNSTSYPHPLQGPPLAPPMHWHQCTPGTATVSVWQASASGVDLALKARRR